MYFAPLFAVEKLNIDPDVLNGINIMGLFMYGVLFLALVGAVAWYAVPLLVSFSRRKRAEKIKAKTSIWFDDKESVLHCGHNKKRIEPKSFEYFVCKITFKAPSKYHKDLTIFDEADRAKGARETRRGVEQAVRRLNLKARELGLKDDLFKRSKERTSVNEEYRQRIVSY